MSSVHIEPMTAKDLDEVLAIERVSFTNPWSRHAFLYELRDNRVAALWVARGVATSGSDASAAGVPSPAHSPAPVPAPAPAPAVVGYLCLWLIADEVHITNLAVHPDHRHRGVGRYLLGTLLGHYRGQGATRAALEVRPGNVQARRLYESFGFRQVGLRKGYYFDTGEDALLMEARLDDLPRLPGEGVPGPERRLTRLP